MCGRFTLRSPSRTRFERVADLAILPRYNIAPSQDVVAILMRQGEPTAELVQWGLIPSWSREAKGIINARCETLEEKPSFTDSFHRRRCLIPADGFYEWKRTGRASQPYFFQLRDESQFMFAGIWDEWRSGAGLITSAAIITTAANDLLASVHDRMPVILHSEFHNAWLDDRTSAEELKELLAPFPAAEMKSHPVSSAVNYVENESANLADHVEFEPGTTPSLF